MKAKKKETKAKDMTYTGVKATDEEVAEIVELAQRASLTPMMLIGGFDASRAAWQRCHERCHAVALAHGLPEIQGFYGLDPEKKEFVAL